MPCSPSAPSARRSRWMVPSSDMEAVPMGRSSVMGPAPSWLRLQRVRLPVGVEMRRLLRRLGVAAVVAGRALGVGLALPGAARLLLVGGEGGQVLGAGLQEVLALGAGLVA